MLSRIFSVALSTSRCRGRLLDFDGKRTQFSEPVPTACALQISSFPRRRESRDSQRTKTLGPRLREGDEVFFAWCRWIKEVQIYPGQQCAFAGMTCAFFEWFIKNATLHQECRLKAATFEPPVGSKGK
jgi:hypothetical protein